MSATDFVKVTVAPGAAPPIAQQNLNVPMVAAYHTHWSDRIRFYPTASILTTLVAQGFSTSEPAYKAAAVIAGQANPPGQIAIGRRLSKPLQSFTMTLTDATVGDIYAFTLVGSDGVSHAISYTIPFTGTAVTGTVAVTNGSANLTFSLSQTMAAGDLLVFASQPGVYYAVGAAISGSTSGALTTNYTGTTAAATTAQHISTLAGTLTPTPGSATVTTTNSQVGVVNVGDQLMFVNQLNVLYTVQAVTASNITLTALFTGPNSGATHASDVSPSTTASAAAVTALVNAITNVAGTIGTVTSSANVITFSRIDGVLTDVQQWQSGSVQNITLANTTADPGIALDIQQILAVNTLGWYGLVLDSNSAPEIENAQVQIEATGQGGKYGFYDNADQADVTSATTDVFSILKSNTYQRCFAGYNGTELLSWEGAATAGYALGQQPGTYTIAYKQLAGVLADGDTSLTETQALILNTMTTSSPGPGGKNANYYKGANGTAFLWPGCTPKGNFVDLVIWMDWLQINIQSAILNLFLSNPRVAYTQFGLRQVYDAILSVYNTAFNNGSADPTQPFTINVPTLASITQASKSSRDLPNVSGTIHYSNAIQTTEVGIIVQF